MLHLRDCFDFTRLHLSSGPAATYHGFPEANPMVSNEWSAVVTAPWANAGTHGTQNKRW